MLCLSGLELYSRWVPLLFHLSRKKLAVAERLFSLIRSWRQALVAVAVVHGEVRWPLWRGFNKMSM